MISQFTMLAESSIWPQSYEQYAITFNSSRWDFSNLSITSKLWKWTPSWNVTFFVKLFEPVNSSELPDNCYVSGIHPNVLQCVAGHPCRYVSDIYGSE